MNAETSLRLISISLASLVAATTALADPWSYGGFVDGYYAYDTNNLNDKRRPYTTQALYNEQTRINLGMLEGRYEGESFRAHLALQAGDSVRANYSAEPERFFRYFQEAVAGYQLTEDLWLDAGIYLSHIGLESFNSKDNWTLSRSILAEFSPYYESGGRLSYKASDTVSAQLHLLNGYQNISDSKHPALGMQVAYAPSETESFVYNNFLGDEGGTRMLNDFIAKTTLSENWAAAAELQIAYQDLDGSESSSGWYGWATFLRYAITPKLSSTLRFERFIDHRQLNIVSLSNESFNSYAASLGVDWEIAPKLFWRNEFKGFFGGNNVHPDGDDFRSNDGLLLTSLQYSLPT